MQLSQTFYGLAFFIIALTGTSLATPLTGPSNDKAVTIAKIEPAAYLMSHEQLMAWLANTDAELTFIGKPLNSLAPRSPQDTTVTYCSSRIGSLCGGACTVYTGGATCLNAPNTNCLAATHNVGFCDRSGCGNSCHDLDTCGTPLAGGFCYTPGTQSIAVSTA